MGNEAIERFGTTRRYSDVVTHGNTVYLVEVPESLAASLIFASNAGLE